MSDVVAGTSDVRSFLRRYREDILAEWRRVVMAVPDARELPSHALIDHIPDVLEEIGYIAEDLERGPTQPETARRHALDRLGEGFDIASVVSELSILRGAMLTIWVRENADGSLGELSALNLAVDRAITASVTRYSEVRERTLRGMDRVSTVSLEATGVDDLLDRLLRVFEETTPSVDTVAVLLVKNGRLVGRAGVGLEEEHARELDIPIGQGFEGLVAAKRTPIALANAYKDPILENDVLRKAKVLALYGLPLVHEGNVIGVAHMGSLTASEFSHEDRQLFASMTARATSGIVHQVLRQELSVSERRSRLAVAERERALAKLEALLAAAPVGIGFVDKELRIVRLNEALAALNEMPVAAHIGRTVGEMYPDLASKLEPIMRRVLETGDPVINLDVVRRSRRNPGERQWLLATYFPVRSESGSITGVGGILLDVTSNKRMQDALKSEQLLLESILAHAPAAIWVKDADGHIVMANQRLANALGHSPREVIGRRTSDLIPSALATQHEDHDRTVLTERRPIEVEEETADHRTFLTVKFPIPGEPGFVGGIGTEITERKQMEEQLRIALRTREELLAVVSHDLRGPLGTVQLSASLLASQVGDDQRARRHLDVITRNCIRMANLINDLLDSARIRAGRLQLDMRRETAESVVLEALDLQQSLAEEKGVHLTLESSLNGIQIECDRGRMLQVFGNLIGNAIKFCRAGDKITVTAKRNAQEVEFTIADTGPGIAPDAIPRLFDPYWSGAGHTKEGAGLGLFIVRGIVERHGGRIWAESTPGHGAKFRFTIPIAP
ncbi:MAG: PAS domain-containing protein [Kofleriaceae bacterium]|nr:PAS domain-containing protein [Kofleriaceae bacterium]